MVQIEATYIGGLRCRARHGPSGAELVTDAPADNHGRGAAFSPTDLVAAAHATCVMTILAIAAEREGIDLAGMTAHTAKHMTADPRRIGALPLRIRVPIALTPAQRETLEAAARACPVCRSLGPDVAREIDFEWGPA